MAQTKNYTGPVWHSSTLKQSFIIISDNVRTEYGLSERVRHTVGNCYDVKDVIVKSQKFTGSPAIRIDDELKALINLTDKPLNYPYDFVLI